MVILLFTIIILIMMICGMRINAMSLGQEPTRYIKEHVNQILCLFILVVYFMCNCYFKHKKDEMNYSVLYDTEFVSQNFAIESLGKSEYRLILDNDSEYYFYPWYIYDVNIEQCALRKYSIRKNADTDTLYIEKGDHKLYVLISKPKVHWYDI